MSADDKATAGQADIGEALVAALGFEPTDGVKQTNGEAGEGGANGTTADGRRSKKSRRRKRSGAARPGATVGGGLGGDLNLNDDIRSAAKPSVSDRSTVIVGGSSSDLDDTWTAIDGPIDADDADTDDAEDAADAEATVEADESEVDDIEIDTTAEDKQSGKNAKPKTDEKSTNGTASKKADTAKKDDADGSTSASSSSSSDTKSTNGQHSAGASSARDDDTAVVAGPPPKAEEPKLGKREPSAPPVASPPGPNAPADPPMAAAAAATGELASMPSPPIGAIGSAATTTVGTSVPSKPPTAKAEPTSPAPPATSPAEVFDPVLTGEIHRIETRDDEIQSARLDAEARARAAGREVFQQGTWGSLFRRSRRLQSRKVRRVVRHIDPWSVLTFSVLFHLCVFAALLLASVLVWNAADAAGTIEDLEGFILELGDYESFEIKGDVVFRAAVGIAGILTLASSVLLVLLTVVFNLISDLVGGIRMTVIEEETVRVRRRSRVEEDPPAP
jgi:hypothetical protein